MGYETNEYVSKCGCIKYVKLHDFFNDEGETWWKYCEKHIVKPKVKEYEASENRKEMRKQYQQSDKYKEYTKKYEASEKRKEYRKQYQQSDKYKEYKKQYRQKNKEKLDVIKNQKTECGCGGCFLEKNKAIHKRTIKHQEWEKQQTTEKKE